LKLEITLGDQMQRRSFLKAVSSLPGAFYLNKLFIGESHKLDESKEVSDYCLKGYTLNPDYIFSNFIVTENTNLAVNSAMNIAKNIKMKNLNPFIIISDAGFGKTHLLHAIGNQILEDNKNIKLLLITAEQLLNEFVRALREDKTKSFREKTRNGFDVILVDDIQDMGRGLATQNEFYEIMRSQNIHQNTVVMASNCIPREIEGLDSRITSLLEGSTIFSINNHRKSFVAIAEAKAKSMNLDLTKNSIELITGHSSNSIRAVEGNLKKIKVYSDFYGASPSIETLERFLSI
jgi:chromosomal replication initiator protein